MEENLKDHIPWRKRLLAAGASGILLIPMLGGCGSGNSSKSGANLPPVDDSAGSVPAGGAMGGQRAQNMGQPKQGMSTGRKVELLVGAAALYYLYKKNKEKHAQGDTSQAQYYLSSNGRVYYRDQKGQAHWVTPPQGGVQVPADEAQQYRDYQGYQGQSQGKTLEGMGG